MKLPRLNLWMLCLAVAAAALVLKLALTQGVLQAFTLPLLFLGPISGIALERYWGGSGSTGGVIAGILSGFTLSLFMNVYLWRLGHPFAWFEFLVSTAAFVMLEAFCGWFWSRQWHLSMAKRTAANPEGNRT